MSSESKTSIQKAAPEQARPLIIREDKPVIFIQPASFEEAKAAALFVAGSKLIPAAYQDKPQEVIVAWQYGAEIGLKPMAALRAIAVINGRPSIYGDGFLAVCQSHPAYIGHEETYDPETETAHCTFLRRRQDGTVGEHHAAFSKEDAETAQLWKKTGPWQQYPKRMLQMRARGFSGRDAFADKLAGVVIAEEAQDFDALLPGEAGSQIAMPRRRSEQTVAEFPAAAAPSEPIEVKTSASPAEPVPATANGNGATPAPAGELFPKPSAPETHTVRRAASVSLPKSKGGGVEYLITLGDERTLKSKDAAVYRAAAAAEEGKYPVTVITIGETITFLTPVKK